ncbi:SIS domain-containing protein [Kineosporia sp. NBRC 101731]|uniref:SIS domain-containing protein n=1 Tax=Kineosporia sp. NBRC 101731 TaxID=3032199 RepID=UPI0024A14D5D|nr:SIS domain-containing protein [Kineosporia sp. NBRC 101731]GLY29037.1 putative tagatose-6-phosphate ketose/aldose isomerase [Kineosporia sp. NBRC 101731]
MSSEDLSALGAASTAEEITHQPAVWRLLAQDLEERADTVRAFLEPLLSRADLRIVLTGAGTSAYAGQVLAPGLSRTLSRRVDAVPTTDIVSHPQQIFAEDVPTLLVSFARSGDSPESLAAVQFADSQLSDVHHLVLTCNPDGALARQRPDRSLVLVMPEGTNDRGFAMTSSFTSMLLACRIVLGGNAGWMEQAARAAEQVLSVMSGPDGLAAQLAARTFERVVYLGSGALTGLARESALKLTELTAGAVPTWAESALGFRHGPKAVLTGSTLALVYLSNDPYTRLYDEDIVTELRTQLGSSQVLVIGASAPRDTTGLTLVPDGLAAVDDAVLAAVFVVAAQELALRFSLAHGIGSDNPFPGGQVNRVVKGVTLHPLPA